MTSFDKLLSISQIIPAQGWLAVYLLDKPPWYYTSPLTFWALVLFEGYDHEHVVGYVGGDITTIAEHVSNFHVYAHESDISPEDINAWINDAREQKRDGGC